MSATDELKPCPFCHGRTNIIIDNNLTWGIVTHEAGCFFLADGLPIKTQHIRQIDFAAWNRRASE